MFLGDLPIENPDLLGGDILGIEDPSVGIFSQRYEVDEIYIYVNWRRTAAVAKFGKANEALLLSVGLRY